MLNRYQNKLWSMTIIVIESEKMESQKQIF